MPNSDTENQIYNPIRQQRRQREYNKRNQNLFVRNILNVVFIIIAVIAMIGVLVDNTHLIIWYIVGLFAVIIKMIEVMMRMPGLNKRK